MFRPSSFGLIIACSLLLFTDWLISLSAFGLYHNSLHFNFTQFTNNLLLTDGYSFVHSPFDFMLLILPRSLFLFAILFTFCPWFMSIDLILKSSPVKFVNIGVQLLNFSFSLIKLLAFSDLPAQLYFAGVWINIVWNILASIFFYTFYIFYQCQKGTDIKPNNQRGFAQSDETNAYQRIEDDESWQNDDQGANLANQPPTQPIISRWAHIVCLLRYYTHYWQWMLLALVFLLIYSSVKVCIPLYTARIISNMVNARQMNEFVSSIITMAIFGAVITLAGGLRAGTLNYMTAKINRRMRRDLFRSITAQEISFFDEAQTGEILSRLIADCETMSSTLSSTIDIFLSNVLIVLGSLAIMLWMSWRLTTVTFILIPPIAFFTKLYSVFYDHLAERAQSSKATANRIAEEVVSSMRNVRAFAAEEMERKRFETQLEATLRVDKSKSLALMGFQWVNELANNVVLVAILFYGGYLVLNSRMTTDQIFAFFLFQLQLGGNFYMLNSVATGLMESVGASRKVFEYLSRRPRIPFDAGKMQPSPVQGKLQFSGVTFAYPTRPKAKVLKNISFNVYPGEMIALVGPSGAGKSTVIALLERFYEPTDGQILLDGTPISQWKHTYFHQKVALVSQEPTLYAGSIRENILYGCEDLHLGEEGSEDRGVGESEMVDAAKLANIHTFVTEETESGYDTGCGERGVQLSGGQKQRIAIARALVRKPAVLLLDEATSALDARGEHQIREALGRCTKGRTVLLIAHRLSTVERADRILVMDQGQIVQMGNHAELMSQKDGLYYSLVQKQLLGSSEGDSSNK